MEISVVKARLATAARAVERPFDEAGDLQCFGYVPNDIDPPCFYAGEATIDPNVTFGDDDIVEIICRLLTSTADDEAGQLLLDKYLARKGDSSVRAALLAARGAPGQAALDGACDDFNIQRVAGYRLYRVGERTFYGAEITIRAIGDGEED